MHFSKKKCFCNQRNHLQLNIRGNDHLSLLCWFYFWHPEIYAFCDVEASFAKDWTTTEKFWPITPPIAFLDPWLKTLLSAPVSVYDLEGDQKHTPAIRLTYYKIPNRMAVAQEAEQVGYQSEGRQIDFSLLKCACRNILGKNIECWAGSNASIRVWTCMWISEMLPLKCGCECQPVCSSIDRSTVRMWLAEWHL